MINKKIKISRMKLKLLKIINNNNKQIFNNNKKINSKKLT